MVGFQAASRFLVVPVWSDCCGFSSSVLRPLAANTAQVNLGISGFSSSGAVFSQVQFTLVPQMTCLGSSVQDTWIRVHLCCSGTLTPKSAWGAPVRTWKLSHGQFVSE